MCMQSSTGPWKISVCSETGNNIFSIVYMYTVYIMYIHCCGEHAALSSMLHNNLLNPYLHPVCLELNTARKKKIR